MTTIKDVAKLAGLSICTVSRALAGKDKIRPETRERVFAAAKELDYKPNLSARSLKTGSTHTLGLIMPDITNPYYPKVAKYIEEYAEKFGYMLFFCNASEDVKREQMLVESLKKRDVDGVLVLPCSCEIKHFESFSDAGIPYVFLNRKFPGNINCVPTDNFYGAYMMTKYVIQAGHRKISAAFLSFENQIYHERFDGAVRALEEHGLKRCVEYFLFDIRDIGDAYQRISQMLLGADRPTALVAANDMICIGAYGAASACGLRIPEDFSVTGYDDIPMAALMIPPLTSYRQSEEEIAKRGVDYLLSCIAGKPQPYGDRLRGEIIVRQSVARL
ncbi:MAG: LacI family transcriptional regulator [Fusobacteriaceae bacterium]|nr:LacI family transcriptional regulator [Fusobacteriaceae bacterium]